MSKRTLPPLALAYEGDVDWEEPSEKTDQIEVHPLGELVQGLSTKEAGILKRAYLERARVNHFREESVKSAEAVKIAHDALPSLNGTKTKKSRREALDTFHVSAEEWHSQGKELVDLVRASVKLSAQARDIIRRLAMSDGTKDRAKDLQEVIFGEDLPPENINAAQVKTMEEIDECLQGNGADLSAYSKKEIEMYRRWVMGTFNPINRRGSPIIDAKAKKSYRSSRRKHPNHRI